MGKKDNIRLLRMALSVNDTAILNVESPWMPMWWSAAMPGLGHLCQGSVLKGLLLMAWEILVNFKANLNMAILYTFTGHFERAKEVLDMEWALFYGIIYFFAIYDSYRQRVEKNMLAQLEKKQARRHYQAMVMSIYGSNYLDRTNPWLAMVWSALLSGFGHFYNRKFIKSVVLLVWAVIVISNAHINDAIIATFKGQFGRVSEIVDYQWILFFPSVYFYAMWDSYTDSVEMNKLFAEAQKSYLREKYSS